MSTQSPLPARSTTPRRPTHLVTHAIEYPNGAPHLGHGYEKILGDAAARYRRVTGQTVQVSLGLDEHSQNVVDAAHRAGQSPQAYCDEIEHTYRDTWRALDIGPHDFIRTSAPEHRAVVESLLRRSYEKGDIYRGSYSRSICRACPNDKKPHVKQGLCLIHKTAVEVETEPTFYFRLSRYRAAIRDHIVDNPNFIAPENYRQTVLTQLNRDIAAASGDYSISRLADAATPVSAPT